MYDLGAFGTDLSLLANFFETPWTHPVSSLSRSNQLWVIGGAGFALRAVGRLADAVGPTRGAAEAHVESGDWKNAAVRYSNLSELQLALGDVPGEIGSARQSVDFADRSGDGFQRMGSRTTLANALHQFGDVGDAMAFLRKLSSYKQSGNPRFRTSTRYRAMGTATCFWVKVGPRRSSSEHPRPWVGQGKEASFPSG